MLLQTKKSEPLVFVTLKLGAAGYFIVIHSYFKQNSDHLSPNRNACYLRYALP